MLEISRSRDSMDPFSKVIQIHFLTILVIDVAMCESREEGLIMGGILTEDLMREKILTCKQELDQEIL